MYRAPSKLFDKGTWSEINLGLCISRAAVTQTEIGSQNVYVFGGKDDKNVNSNSLIRVDLGAETYEILPTTGETPPSSYNGLISSFNNTLVLYGGETGEDQYLDTLYTLDLGISDFRVNMRV